MTGDPYYLLAYKKGSEAFRDGYPTGANPYSRKTRNYTEWLNGWYDAREVRRAK